jgi:hypothetical protein
MLDELAGHFIKYIVFRFTQAGWPPYKIYIVPYKMSRLHQQKGI